MDQKLEFLIHQNIRVITPFYVKNVIKKLVNTIFIVQDFTKKKLILIKKRYMIYGSTFEIFNTSDYNLNLEERRAKYMFKYKYTILCENVIMNLMAEIIIAFIVTGKKQILIKTLYEIWIKFQIF